MALVTLAELKAQLSVTGSGEDTALTAFLAAADAAVKSYCARPFEDTTATVYLDGNGSQMLPLPGRYFPVTTFTDCRLDFRGGFGQATDSFGTDTVLTQGQDYFYDAAHRSLVLWRYPSVSYASWPVYRTGPGGLSLATRTGPVWPRMPGCVRLTGLQYGYATEDVPADLKAAVIQIAAWLRQTQELGGLVPGSTSYIDVSVGTMAATEALGSRQVPALGSARSLLAPYREPAFAGGWL
jgi:hypothetical protein